MAEAVNIAKSFYTLLFMPSGVIEPEFKSEVSHVGQARS